MNKNLTDNDAASGTEISTLRIVLRLLVNPGVYKVVQHKNILSSLILVIILSVISGSVISVSAVFVIRKSAVNWDKWLQSEVQDFGISEDGKFYWQLSGEIPYTAQIEGWQIDIRNESINDQRPAELSPGTKGLWINHETIFLWLKVRSGNLCTTSEEMIVKKYDFGRNLIEILKLEGVTRISLKDLGFVRFIENHWLTIYILICITNVITVLCTVLLFPLISAFFSIIPSYAIKSNQRKSVFRKLLVLNLHSSIPPILIATFYSTLQVPGTSYFTVFFIAFICYHMYLMNTFRTLLSSE